MSRFQDKWVFVKHKYRETFEIPGGRRDEDETVTECARRELSEETGATEFELVPLDIYSIKHEDDSVTYGQMFLADIFRMTDLPESEIGEVRLCEEPPEELTYASIHPVLFQRAVDHLREV